MTTEPSDAETCLHVSISEANKSGHVRGMTEQVRHDSAPARFAGAAGGTKKKGPLEVFLKGPVNPAATYSPGPGGQVPSAI